MLRVVVFAGIDPLTTRRHYLREVVQLGPKIDDQAEAVRLLARRGDLAALTTRADAGDLMAARYLASSLARRGDLDELAARATNGDEAAAERLAEHDETR